jgi:small subunit ribosomal protein S5
MDTAFEGRGGDRGGRGRGRGGDRDRDRGQSNNRFEVESEFTEEVIYINRVAKVVKGGRKFQFSALVALGDKKGQVGIGYGKAAEVVDAIRKAVDEARRTMITVYREGTTIPYELHSHSCSSTIIMRPAKKGHGIIAGGAARAIIALSGIEDVTAKFVGSTNKMNTAHATFEALKSIKSPDYIMRLRRGEKMDKLGRFPHETKRSVAQEAIEQFTAEEAAANAATEARLASAGAAKEEGGETAGEA